MKETLLKSLEQAASASGLPVRQAGISGARIALDYPENPDHGDFTTNIALAEAKKAGMKPRDLAEKIIAELKKDLPASVESIEMAGPGFINFKLKDKVFSEEIVKIVAGGAEYGWRNALKGQKMMVEYTDPNPFKVFHIGHLMANAIGESISRLAQSSGAEVIRVCYQGDVGLHVAKAIWGLKFLGLDNFNKIENSTLEVKVKFLGDAYIMGNAFYEDIEKLKNEFSAITSLTPEQKNSAKREIEEINKKIFDKSDKEINTYYEKGREWSLEYFDSIYKRLGTNFDKFFFESEVADYGLMIVREFLQKKIFEESDNAVVFKGEDHGLHTRVFITSKGLPTYETKELGLNKRKFELYPDLTKSIIITANEQNDYFRVLLKVLSLIDKTVFSKTEHMSHGILRFASGKMSSRLGNIVSADALIANMKTLVTEKIADRKFSAAEAEEISDQIAIGAIKYTILRSSIGSDIIFDSSASISFEGDSGPYLQYATVRANSILEKAKQEGIADVISALPEKASFLERLITRFPDILERAAHDRAPQIVANYLIGLSGAFNAFYAKQVIVDVKDPLSPYYVNLTKAFVTAMTNGLWVLGIKVPKRM